MLPKGVLRYAMKLPALQGRSAAQLLADLGHPGRGRSSTSRFEPHVRRARHQARARGLGHRAAAAGDLRGQAVGLLGAQPRPGPVQGPLVRGRRQRQDRGHHRRLERHRPGGRAEDRRGRRDPDPRRPLAGQARGGQGRDRGAPAAPRTSTPCDLSDYDAIDAARREDPLRARLRSTCSSTTRAARSGARWRSPTTASTTSSARCSSTTSARSS